MWYWVYYFIIPMIIFRTDWLFKFDMIRILYPVYLHNGWTNVWTKFLFLAFWPYSLQGLHLLVSWIRLSCCQNICHYYSHLFNQLNAFSCYCFVSLWSLMLYHPYFLDEMIIFHSLHESTAFWGQICYFLGFVPIVKFISTPWLSSH